MWGVWSWGKGGQGMKGNGARGVSVGSKGQECVRVSSALDLVLDLLRLDLVSVE